MRHHIFRLCLVLCVAFGAAQSAAAQPYRDQAKETRKLGGESTSAGGEVVITKDDDKYTVRLSVNISSQGGRSEVAASVALILLNDKGEPIYCSGTVFTASEVEAVGATITR